MLPVIRLDLFTSLLHGYRLTSSDLENLFSNVHSRDEYLCQVSIY